MNTGKKIILVTLLSSTLITGIKYMRLPNPGETYVFTGTILERKMEFRQDSFKRNILRVQSENVNVEYRDTNNDLIPDTKRVLLSHKPSPSLCSELDTVYFTQRLADILHEKLVHYTPK